MNRFGNFVYLKIGIALIALVIFAVSLLSLIAGHKWIGKPYPGYFVFKNRLVSSFQTSSYFAQDFPISYPDIILKVNKKNVNTGKEIYEYVSSLPANTMVTYTIKRHNKIINISVPSSVFTKNDFVSTAVVLNVIGILTLFFGVIILIFRRQTMASVSLMGTLFTTGAWLSLTFDFIFVYNFPSLLPAFVSFIAFFVLMLSYYFPEKKIILKRTPVLPYLFVIPSFLVFILYEIFFSEPEVYSYLDFSYWGYTSITILILLISIAYSAFRGTTLEIRKRTRIVLYSLGSALFIAFIGASSIFWGSGSLFLFALIGVFLWLSFFGYIVFKHNIFETEMMIRKTVVYGIITVIIAGIYVLILSILGYILGNYNLFNSPIFPILFSIFVLFIFIPLRDKIKNVVDKTFYHDRYELEKTLEKAIEAISSIVELNKLMEFLLNSLSDALHIDRSMVLLPVTGGDYSAKALRGGLENIRIPGNHPILQTLNVKREALIRRETDAEERKNIITQTMKDIGIKIIIPMFYRERLSGLMLLGEKMSGAEYVKEDLRLLGVLGKQAAIAIENARLHEEEKEKERMAQELESARRIQLSLLPREDPVMEGLEVCGVSKPAKEVGGDYYDYFKLGGDRLGVVIADVTGKGMASALLMSMVKSSLSALVKMGEGPKEIVAGLNEIICEMKGKLPVTLFFGVIDMKHGSMRYCSAGHDYPYISRADVGEIRHLECLGMPLGSVSGYAYEEREAELNHGDTIVFYTDGVIEAMNERREMFGFERLERVIMTCNKSKPDEIKERILKDVELFTRTRELNDDLTLVIVRIK